MPTAYNVVLCPTGGIDAPSRSRSALNESAQSNQIGTVLVKGQRPRELTDVVHHVAIPSRLHSPPTVVVFGLVPAQPAATSSSDC